MLRFFQSSRNVENLKLLENIMRSSFIIDEQLSFKYPIKHYHDHEFH